MDAVTLAQKRSELARYVLLAYCFVPPCVPALRLGGIRVAPVDVMLPLALPLVLSAGSSYMFGPARWLAALIWTAFISLTQIAHASAMNTCFMKAVRFGAISMPFFLACSLRPNPRILKEAVWIFYVAGLVSMITGVIFYAFDIDLGLDVQTFKFGDELHSRAVGVFGESGQFAHLLVTWMLVSILLLPIVSPSAKSKFATLIAMQLGIVCLYLSLSRGGIGNLVTALLAATVLPSTRKVLKNSFEHLRLPMLIFAGTATVGVLVAIGTGLADTIIQTLQLRFIEGTLEAYSENPDVATSGRFDAWSRGLRRFQESPFLGQGYKAMTVGQYFSSDNQYVGTLYDQGLLGFVALLGFFLRLFGRFRQLARRGSQVATIIQVIWVGQLVQAMTTDILTFWGGMPALLGLTGLIAAGHTGQLAANE